MPKNDSTRRSSQQPIGIPTLLDTTAGPIGNVVRHATAHPTLVRPQRATADDEELGRKSDGHALLTNLLRPALQSGRALCIAAIGFYRVTHRRAAAEHQCHKGYGCIP